MKVSKGLGSEQSEEKLRWRKLVRKNIGGFVFVVMLLALCLPANAQQLAKIPRIGFLAAGGAALPEAFVKALGNLGYANEKNITFEYRSRDGRPERDRDLAAELVRLKVDIIVADGSGPAAAAKNATDTIPIVMTSSTDPVGIGLVASLARPRGNVTGLSSVSGELGGKLLEILKEIIPQLVARRCPRTATGQFDSRLVYQRNGESRACVESSSDTSNRARRRGLRKHLSSRDQRTRSGSSGAHPGEYSCGTAQAVRGVSCKASPAGDLPGDQLDRRRRPDLIRGGPQLPVPTHRTFTWTKS